MFKPFLHDYAYGWRVSKILPPKSKDSLNIISHGGGINGFNSLITRLIDDKYFIILLDNTSGNGPWDLENIKRINSGIINILYGKTDEL